MRLRHRLLALPLLVAASAAPALGDVRDRAGLFSPEAVKKADAELARIERETSLPVTIETIPSLNGRGIDEALAERGRQEDVRGLFVLISKQPHKIEAGASPGADHFFNRPLYQAIRGSFLPDFERNDYDAGLAAGVAKIEGTLRALKAEHGPLTPAAARAVARPPARAQGPAPAPAPAPGPRMPAQARSGLPILIGIVLLVLGVLFVFRLLGALFGAGRGGYGPGYGPGPMRGPGYGGPGYGGGGGGGGFMSSLFGGLGGAMAGNWLYDQFGRRHDQPGYVPPAGQDPAAPPDAGAGWGTAGDEGATWGGGGDAGGGGGGDWGGGGGGGDWGGGGGGGGDWGGGGGGGDWGGGGGGDGGGSW